MKLTIKSMWLILLVFSVGALAVSLWKYNANVPLASEGVKVEATVYDVRGYKGQYALEWEYRGESQRGSTSRDNAWVYYTRLLSGKPPERQEGERVTILVDAAGPFGYPVYNKQFAVAEVHYSYRKTAAVGGGVALFAIAGWLIGGRRRYKAIDKERTTASE